VTNSKMGADDFREIILSSRENSPKVIETITVFDYLMKVKDNPLIAQYAPARIYNMIMKHGVEQVDESQKIRGYEDLVSYNFFKKGKIFGSLESIHDIMRFLKAAAMRTETGRRILILIGPVSSGKSTIATLIKRGLEEDDTPKYAVSGCPLHEEPLHVIPKADRDLWNKKLDVQIEGDLCPVCQYLIDTEYTIDGHVHWENIPVERIFPNEMRRVCIGTFQPSDLKTQDVSELIGSVDFSKMTKYGENDPRAYQFNGELQIANGGLIEYIELLKAEVRLHYVLITAAQEQRIKPPRFPQMYIDTLILGHSNMTEFDNFKAKKENEALHDRMYPITVPWNLKVDNEIAIYEKLIGESNFSDIHICPNTLKTAAQFAILTRLSPSTKVTNLVEKMKLYNGERTEILKTEDVNIKLLRTEGREAGEGMKGISPRFIMNAINVALGSKEHIKCITPIDILRGIKKNFDHHVGISEEEKRRYLDLLLGEKDSVNAEFKEIAKKEVQLAFLSSFEDQAKNLFDNYIRHAMAFCKKQKIEDQVTGEFSSPDEKLMRDIEERIGVPVNSKNEFRQGIFVHKSACLEDGKVFDFNTYPPLKEAIESKLMSDLKNTVNLTLCEPGRAGDKKTIKRRSEVMETLKERGYCPHCANVLLAFVSEILRKEN
jgi:serine protein kinase